MFKLRIKPAYFFADFKNYSLKLFNNIYEKCFFKYEETPS